jgi:hypothetical protein
LHLVDHACSCTGSMILDEQSADAAVTPCGPGLSGVWSRSTVPVTVD